jgi:uncharacterized protein YlxW (UPF0749 family)
MVVLIVAIVMVASIIRAKYGYSRRGRHIEATSPEERAETLRLRDEVKELKERIKVLERITVEKENSLSKQIEELRDR